MQATKYTTSALPCATASLRPSARSTQRVIAPGAVPSAKPLFQGRTLPLRTSLSPFAAEPSNRPDSDANASSSSSESVKYNTEFGYSRKDIILIGAGLIAFGYVLYYGLQASGMDAGMAGNWVQLIIFLGICVGWIGSYLFRVATKNMTYAKQLEEYEEAVMKKRLEEMPEAELEQVMADIEKEKAARRGGGGSV